MELSDLWNLKFGALWDPSKVKPIPNQNHRKNEVLPDDFLEHYVFPGRRTFTNCRDSNVTVTYCIDGNDDTNEDVAENGLLNNHNTCKPVELNGVKIHPHVQVTFHGWNDDGAEGDDVDSRIINSLRNNDIDKFANVLQNSGAAGLDLRFITIDDGRIESHRYVAPHNASTTSPCVEAGNEQNAVWTFDNGQADRNAYQLNRKVNPFPLEVWRNDLESDQWSTCHMCNGNSINEDGTCDACEGEGEIFGY